MTRLRILAVLALAIWLTGCALLDGVGPDDELVGPLRGAEGLVQAPDGRVFASGQDGVFRVTDPTGETPQVRRLEGGPEIPAGCQYTGLTAWGDALYAVCTTGDHSFLVYADLAREPVRLNSATELPGVPLANGLAVDDRGTLYVADSLNRGASITRITVTGRGPLTARTQAWLDTEAGAPFPNGVQFKDGTLYLSSAGRLSAIEVAEDGRPEKQRVLFSRLTFLEDFRVLESGFLLTDQTFNRLILMNAAGAVQARFRVSGEGPSAVLVIRDEAGPVILVTQRASNRVTRLRVPERYRGYF